MITKGQTHEWDSLHRFPNENLKPEKPNRGKYLTLFFSRPLFRFSSARPSNRPLRPTSGYSSVLVQAGQVRNSGLEMLLNYHNTWRDFTWNTSVTYTMNRNKIIRLANGVISPVDGQPIDMPYLEKATLGDAGSPQVILYEGGTMGDLYINRELRTDLNGNIYVDPQTNKVELTTTERRKGRQPAAQGQYRLEQQFCMEGAEPECDVCGPSGRFCRFEYRGVPRLLRRFGAFGGGPRSRRRADKQRHGRCPELLSDHRCRHGCRRIPFTMRPTYVCRSCRWPIRCPSAGSVRRWQ